MIKINSILTEIIQVNSMVKMLLEFLRKDE